MAVQCLDAGRVAGTVEVGIRTNSLADRGVAHPLSSCDRFARRTLHRMSGLLAKTPLAGAFVCLHVGVVRVLIFEGSPPFGGLTPRLAAKLRPPKVPFVSGSASNRVPAAMAWAGRCLEFGNSSVVRTLKHRRGGREKSGGPRC